MNPGRRKMLQLCLLMSAVLVFSGAMVVGVSGDAPPRTASSPGDRDCFTKIVEGHEVIIPGPSTPGQFTIDFEAPYNILLDTSSQYRRKYYNVH